MKSNQVSTRMSREDIDFVAKLARASHMTPSAMLRRLVLERLEQIALAQSPQGFKEQAEGETNEIAQTPRGLRPAAGKRPHAPVFA